MAGESCRGDGEGKAGTSKFESGRLTGRRQEHEWTSSRSGPKQKRPLGTPSRSGASGCCPRPRHLALWSQPSDLEPACSASAEARRAAARREPGDLERRWGAEWLRLLPASGRASSGLRRPLEYALLAGKLAWSPTVTPFRSSTPFVSLRLYSRLKNNLAGESPSPTPPPFAGLLRSLGSARRK